MRRFLCVLVLVASSAFAQDATMPRLRMDVQLAMIPVHVTGASGGVVTGLDRANFRLFDDGIEQRIAYFGQEAAPLSVGFLVDTSKSMGAKIAKSLEAARQFLKSNLPDDEFFLVEFNEHPRLTVDFTTDPERLYDRLKHTRPIGRTSLLDAVALSLKQEKRARNPRKALVILSDGGDNHSRLKEREVLREARESDVAIYAMGIFDEEGSRGSTEERNGPRLLKTLAEDTGGKHFPVERLEDLAGVCARVDAELRHQYVLGYSPQAGGAVNDGRYHKIKVVLDSPAMHAEYRPGYFAPQ